MAACVWQVAGHSSIACLSHMHKLLQRINTTEDGTTLASDHPDYIASTFKIDSGQPDKVSTFFDNQVKITYANDSTVPDEMYKLINWLCSLGYETHWSSSGIKGDKGNWTRVFYEVLDRPGGPATLFDVASPPYTYPSKPEILQFMATFFKKQGIELAEIIGDPNTSKPSAGAPSLFFVFQSPAQAVTIRTTTTTEHRLHVSTTWQSPHDNHAS
ncbi:hypothetical protein CC85DRAFT_285636 [Cutaneotrichosporon oleaginosum]|uniref:Uncharacterized protein n=1 Tax=Cutaneotrichosporon oleaginosum TaxID=879819 RepID=A0A0J1B448_9TREE|nr:uncharacterized protein CC85DRAFT_285636 [Cutaneotrichosporon oleaginosum]KLT42404.1 hypothetical protein CC85DRAFT_285636 [Cutaneotrichosporon oleaginosum]TXT04223.1 hypothetical protein COLE_07920 [Cutaneotrichosporon oleaginosum]